MNQPVRNIEYIKTKTPYKNQKYGIIIPAAGCASRMKCIGSKSLLCIKNIPLIDRQLDIINKTFPKKEIILVTGFEADKVLNYTGKYNITRVENEKYEYTNISRSIAIGLRACNCDSIIIIYGDLYFNKELLDLPFNNKSIIVCCNTMTTNEVGCIINNNIIENIFYDLPQKWAQVAYFTGDELEILKKIVFDRKNNLLYGYEIINKIIDRGGKFKAIFPKDAYSQDIDTTKDLLLVERL